MRGTETAAVVAVKILVKWEVVAKVRVCLELRVRAQTSSAPRLVAQEQPREPAAELVRNLEQVQVAPGAGGTLQLEIVAVVVVKFLERLDQKIIDRHPDRAAPVRVSPEKSRLGVTRGVADDVALTVQVEDVGVITMVA
jgi:hypothetical protein